MEDKYLNSNRTLWNELTSINSKSNFYEVEKFKEGNTSLKPIEINELGSVDGKTLLHLQCHFGMDTLSWSRLGAKVTGVDFSDKAIELARTLSAELGIESEFICSNIYDLPNVLDRKFDICFTSYGVLCWLPDISKWAEIIASFLKKGGIFYIVEGHPFNNVFDNESNAKELKAKYSYFHNITPNKWENEGAYADRDAQVLNPSYEWTHSMGDIINALISNGLKIEFLHEFPYCNYDHFPFMMKGEDDWWRFNKDIATLPLMFSIKAIKE